MNEPSRALFDRFGLGDGELRHIFGAALERNADDADLYFEFRRTSSVQLEESLVKQAVKTTSRGAGVRVVAEDRTGYAHTDEITVASLKTAAALAARISDSPSRSAPQGITPSRSPRGLYALESAPVETSISGLASFLDEIDVAARAYDSRIRRVIASVVTEESLVWIARADGRLVGDLRPLVRLRLSCVAEDSGRTGRGISGGGGRIEIGELSARETWRRWVEHASNQALRALEAVDAPAGEQVVVLGPGWPGVLLHEAVGHGLEADFNRKGVSAFSNRIGERVASDLCTVIDDGTLPGRRGSLEIDDEGTPTERTVLIERGILKGYLHDQTSARLLDAAPTGNGRRESYAHAPLPRMTNTFLAAGTDAPEDVIRSVDRGLYASDFGGGQVDITSGSFVFSANEAYLIEGGRLTQPVKGATLIGSGPEVLKRVSRVGADLALDDGVGTCSKDGQLVPVGVGMPTVRIDGITVGGSRAS